MKTQSCLRPPGIASPAVLARLLQPWAAPLLAAVLWLVPAVSRADGATEAWVQRYCAPTRGHVHGNKVVTDLAGNVIVAGSTEDGVTGKDMLVIKYSGAGVPLWTNLYNGPENADEGASDLAVDASDNVYVAGGGHGSRTTIIKYSSAGVPLWTNRHDIDVSWSLGTAMAVTPNGNVYVTGRLGSVYYGDAATIKYSSAGVLLWANRGPNGVATALAVDASGNVYVVGASGMMEPSSPGGDYLTIKYSSAGVPLWTNLYNGPDNVRDWAYAVAVDDSGNVYVTGASPSGNYGDAATIKYSSAGVELWVMRHDGPAGYRYPPYAVAVDASANVYVAGRFRVSDSVCVYGTVKYSTDEAEVWVRLYDGLEQSSAALAVAVDANSNVYVTGESYGGPSRLNYATVKYSTDGEELWARRYHGPEDGDNFVANALALDASGNVYVTGSSPDSTSGSACATIAYSSTGVALWTNRYTWLAHGHDYAKAVAVDASGNVVVTGSSAGGGYINDYATIKYSSAGMPLWTNRYDGPANGDDGANALAVDASGNVYVTGQSRGTDSGDDYATIKYSSAGVPLWTNRYDAGYWDRAQALAVDASGNVYVAGSDSWDYTTIKYSSAGVPLWTSLYDGPDNQGDAATALAVDDSGNVYVTGASSGSTSGSDYATIKYSSAGVPLWTKRYNGPGNGEDHATSLAVDAAGNVYVTGYSLGSSSSYDFATIAYSTSGLPLWTNRYNGPVWGEDRAVAVAADASGNVYVTGGSFGGDSGYDYATIAYASAGTPLWTNRYNGPANGDDYAVAVAVDGGGNVVVIGYSTNTSSGWDYATVAYSGAGVPLWTNRYNGPGNGDDYARAVEVDADGNVFVAGESWGDGTGFDFAVVKYVTRPAITRQPLSRTNDVGTTAAFSVTAIGVEPLHYQWRKDGTNLLDGVNLAGIATTNLTVGNVQPGDAGDYTVVVTNAVGGVTSSVALLTVEGGLPETLQAQALATGQLRLMIQGSPGRVFTLQGSPDLFHWARLGTHTNQSGTLVLTNPQAAGRNAYFYRTVVFPSVSPPAVPAPTLSGAAWLLGGRMRFDVNAVANSAWRVEGTPDLMHWGNYGVVTNPSGVLPVTNTPVGRPRTYFYRVAQP